MCPRELSSSSSSSSLLLSGDSSASGESVSSSSCMLEEEEENEVNNESGSSVADKSQKSNLFRTNTSTISDTNSIASNDNNTKIFNITNDLLQNGSCSDNDEGIKLLSRIMQARTKNRKVSSSVADVLSLDDECCNNNVSNVSNSCSLYTMIFSVVAGTLCGLSVILFAWYLPFIIQPNLAPITFVRASFNYQADISFFDHTAWTYVTDYILATVMLAWAYVLLKNNNNNDNNKAKSTSGGDYLRTLSYTSSALLVSYALSVTCGGLCHQYLYTIEARSQMIFRVMWTTCISCVTFASTFMGILTSALVKETRRQQKQHEQQSLTFFNYIPAIPYSFWIAFGVFTTTVCIAGGMSFQRPAADTFVAGITQFPSTFYAVAYWLSLHNKKATSTKNAVISLSLWQRCTGAVAWLGNAPLLPLYPLLLHYTDWSLATINTTLHAWLLVAWSMQGWSLYQVQNVLQQSNNNKDSVAAKFSTSAVPSLKVE